MILVLDASFIVNTGLAIFGAVWLYRLSRVFLEYLLTEAVKSRRRTSI